MDTPEVASKRIFIVDSGERARQGASRVQCPRMDWKITALVPLAQVADIDRSIAFYQKLGLIAGGRTKDGNIDFAGLRTERGDTVLMLTRRQKAAVTPEKKE